MTIKFKNGSGIHIKKENKGKFTSYCGGKVTSACIQKGKHSSNPAIRKRATFAANARKWKHKLGGQIIIAQQGTKTIKAGELAKQHLQKSKAPDWQSVDYGYKEMLRNGLDHSQAVAILGNTIQENSGSPKGQGIIQWTGVPVPGGLKEQWKSVIDSVNDDANIYDRKTDTMLNWWGKYKGQNGKIAQQTFRNKSTSIPEKTRIYSTSYIRPGKPELNKRVLFAQQLDSIYNPRIKNNIVTLKKFGGTII